MLSRAAILYTRADAERSRVLVRKYFAAFCAHGAVPELMIVDRLSPGSVLAALRGADFIINRTRDAELASFLENAGLFVSNPSALTRTANDKLATYGLLHGAVPMLETVLCGDRPPLPFPFVAKPAAGHGGSGVSMIKSAADYAAYRAAHPEKSVCQPLCDTLGRDMRVYVIGGRPAAAVMRESDTDFRSNFSLGGRAVPIRADGIPKAALEIVGRVCEALPLDYAGVDVMPHAGGWVLNEIEDPVGARMLYINGLLDPAAAHAEYLLRLRGSI